MRRADFLYEDEKIINDFLAKISFGSLAIPTQNAPYIVPVSFCFCENELYYHGAMGGRKFELLKSEPKVSFNAVYNYAYIASNFLNNTMIPTQFFFSVYLEGDFQVVTEVNKRKKILEELVKKYEPNKEISMNEGHFKDKDRGVFIGVVKPSLISAKAKFGQNMPKDKIEILIKDLENRGESLDFETIALIKKFHPAFA